VIQRYIWDQLYILYYLYITIIIKYITKLYINIIAMEYIGEKIKLDNIEFFDGISKLRLFWREICY